MSENPLGDVPEPASPKAEAETAVHHGEALVAALLNTQQSLAADPLGSPPMVETKSTAAPDSTDASLGVPTPPASIPPLTASSVISHTVLPQTAPVTPSMAATTASITTVQADDPEFSGESPDHEVGSQAEPVSNSDPAAQSGDGGDGDDGIDAEPEDEDEPSLTRNLLEWVVVLGAAVAVAIILRTFVFQAFYIPSESMEVTLFEDDRILVNKVSYRLHDVNRGDVVVFRRPDDQPGDIRDLIKRVIGLAGEEVEGRDSQIYIDGQLLVEPYLDGNRFGDFGPVTVPEGELFMMGDNRDQSLDSRRFGPIDSDRIVGRAFFLFYPFDRIGSL